MQIFVVKRGMEVRGHYFRLRGFRTKTTISISYYLKEGIFFVQKNGIHNYSLLHECYQPEMSLTFTINLGANG